MSALAPDGRMIAYVTGDSDVDMRLFVRDLSEGQAVEILRRRLITDLAWMPDGSRVIVAGFDKDTRGAWSAHGSAAKRSACARRPTSTWRT